MTDRAQLQAMFNTLFPNESLDQITPENIRDAMNAMITDMYLVDEANIMIGGMQSQIDTIASVEGGLQSWANTVNSQLAADEAILANKVDKTTTINGQALSSNVTISIPAAQVNSDWSAVSGISAILNKPSIPAAQIQSDWNQINTSALDYIKNKPSIPSGQIQSDWNQSTSSAVDFIKNKPTIPVVLTTTLTGFSSATIAAINSADSVLQAFGKAQAQITANNTRTISSFTPVLVGAGATGTQLSATKFGTVRATFSTQVTVTLGGSPVSRVSMKICATNDPTEANWTEIGRTGTAQPTTLTVTVGGVYTQEGQICGDVPAGWYYKFVNSGTGTRAETAISGQQTIYG